MVFEIDEFKVSKSPKGYNGRKLLALLHALSSPPPFADPSSIKMILSAFYLENVLKFLSCTFMLTALKALDKSERVITMKMGAWHTLPRELNFFHGLADAPVPRGGMCV